LPRCSPVFSIKLFEKSAGRKYAKRVPHKRKPSAHQKQIRFFTVFFGSIMIAVLVTLLWFLNSTGAFQR
jgi:hypothetical protein